MQSKSLLIAIAAFAVTTTGVHAYGGAKILNRAGLTTEQKAALVEAQELKAVGQLNEAHNKLLKAGIDDDVLRSINQARHAAHDEMLRSLREDDFTAFRVAIEDSPLADLITTKADFEQFREAHELRSAGEFSEAADIFAELGIEHGGERPYHSRGLMRVMRELNPDQREAFMVAKRANDKATMQAILDEAGIELSQNRDS